VLAPARQFRRGAISLVHGDITALDVDVIVNAANAALCGGGGVDGAIHRAAGPRLLEACRALGPAKAGDAVLTEGFELQARYVAHAVGPVWQGGESGEPAQLESAYRSSLERAREVGARSIAFPCISTGAYRYPFGQAAKTAIRTVDTHMDRCAVARVTFCCFTESDVRRYAVALEQYFGPRP